MEILSSSGYIIYKGSYAVTTWSNPYLKGLWTETGEETQKGNGVEPSKP